MKKIILVLILLLVCGVGWASKIDILWINKEIFDSFERIKGEEEKTWHTFMFSPQQKFFNSIWLTDREYENLKNKKEVFTHYQQKPIVIKIEDNECEHKDIRCMDCGMIVDERYLEKINSETLDKIYSMLADLHIKFMNIRRDNEYNTR